MKTRISLSTTFVLRAKIQETKNMGNTVILVRLAFKCGKKNNLSSEAIGITQFSLRHFVKATRFYGYVTTRDARIEARKLNAGI